MSLRILFLLMSLPLSCAAQGIPAVFEQWIAFQKKNAADMHVTFKQERYTPVLKEPVRTEGRFWKMLDGRFRLELGTPPTNVVLYDREKLLIKEGKDSSWETVDPDDKRAKVWMKIIGNEQADEKALTDNFSVKVTDEGPKHATITLVPRPLLLKKHLKQVDMQIEPGGLRMYLLRIIQGDGGVLTMTFDPRKVVTGDVSRLFRP